jgi:hypothetical protein
MMGPMIVLRTLQPFKPGKGPGEAADQAGGVTTPTEQALQPSEESHFEVAPKALEKERGPANVGGVSVLLRLFIKRHGWACLISGTSGGVQRVAPGGLALSELQRAPALAYDPAKGKTSPGSVEEAAVGLAAERAGIVVPPLMRDPSGAAEFIDGAGTCWDVKSPLSPGPEARWKFDALHQLKKVQFELNNGSNVLLNLSRCTPEDAEQVVALLDLHLDAAQRARVWILQKFGVPA